MIPRIHKLRANHGLTLIELTVMVAVGSLIIVAVSLLLTRGFTISREQTAQVRATQTASDQATRITRAIENARTTGDGGEWYIPPTGLYALTLNTSVDNDTDTEVVRYFVEQKELKRGVTEAGQAEQVTTVARDVLNGSVGHENDPLFIYNQDDQGVITSVTLRIIVDVNPGAYPPETVVTTDTIVPRQPLLSMDSSSRAVEASLPEVGSVLGQTAYAAPNPQLGGYGMCPYAVGGGYSAGGALDLQYMCAQDFPYCMYAGTTGPSGARVFKYPGLPKTDGAWVDLGQLDAALPNNSTAAAVMYYDNALYAGTYPEGNVYRLQESGWTKVGELGSGIVDIVIHNDGGMYAATIDDVFKYVADDNWTTMGSIVNDLGVTEIEITTITSHGGRMYAGLKEGGAARVVYFNASSGKWRDSSGPFPSAEEVFSIAPYFDSWLYTATGNSGDGFRFNGSNTWQTVTRQNDFPDGSTISSLRAFFDGLLYASVNQGGAAKIFAYGGGQNWFQKAVLAGQGTSQIHHLFTYANRLCASTGGGKGKVYCKDEGADTWSVIGGTDGIGNTTDVVSDTFGLCAPVAPAAVRPASFQVDWTNDNNEGGENLDLAAEDDDGDTAGVCQDPPEDDLEYGDDGEIAPGKTPTEAIDFELTTTPGGRDVTAYAKWRDLDTDDDGVQDDAGEFSLYVSGLHFVNSSGETVTEQTYTCQTDAVFADICSQDPDQTAVYTNLGYLHDFGDPDLTDGVDVQTIFFPSDACAPATVTPTPTPTAIPTPTATPTATPSPDSDGDGIPDDQDGCPLEAGPPENGGCPNPTPSPVPPGVLNDIHVTAHWWSQGQFPGYPPPPPPITNLDLYGIDFAELYSGALDDPNNRIVSSCQARVDAPLEHSGNVTGASGDEIITLHPDDPVYYKPYQFPINNAFQGRIYIFAKWTADPNVFSTCEHPESYPYYSCPAYKYFRVSVDGLRSWTGAPQPDKHYACYAPLKIMCSQNPELFWYGPGSDPEYNYVGQVSWGPNWFPSFGSYYESFSAVTDPDNTSCSEIDCTQSYWQTIDNGEWCRGI